MIDRYEIAETPVWAYVRGQWRPATWVRTISRGRHAGRYVVIVGFQRRRMLLPPDCVREQFRENKATRGA